MKTFIKQAKLQYFFAALLGIIIPFFSFAASTEKSSPAMLLNPLPVAQELYCPTAYCDLQQMILLIIKDFLAIIPIVSVLFIIVGGVKLVISRGNEEAITQGKKIILWAILGLIFAFLSFSFISIIQSLLQANF